jgi:uncharacterized LabA/DUF88 family protein
MINPKTYKDNSINKNSMYPGDPEGSPDESLSETLVFIDEGFLTKLSKYFGNGKYLKFDKYSFSKNLCKKQKLKCKKIYYYTAPPFQGEPPTAEEENKKDGYDRFIRKLKEKNIIVKEGRCQRIKCDGNFIYQQKSVDILMAIDLTNIPIRFPEIKKIILVSSDSDFVPVINNLEENKVETILYTFYEKKRHTPFSVSNHLIKSVYKYKLLTKEDFTNFPLGGSE